MQYIYIRKIGDGKFTDFALVEDQAAPACRPQDLSSPVLPFAFPCQQNRAGNLTARKRDDSCPMETDSVMSSRNQSGRVTSHDDTCDRDYSDRHFDRVMRLAAVRLSEPGVHRTRDIPSGNAKTHPPSSLSVSLSLSFPLYRNQILIVRHTTEFGRFADSLLQYEESCWTE